MNWLNRNINSIIGVALSFSWVVLFALGLVISSESYRANVTEGNWSMVDLVMIFFTYTPINTALLAIVSATVAGLTSNINAKNYAEQVQKNSIDTSKIDINSAEFKRLSYMNESPMVSMMRGFLAYLLLIAGSFIVADSPFTNTSQDQYLRLAGTISILAYTLGYDPSRLQDMLDKVPLKGTK